MERIESKQDLITWAKEINYGIDTARKCDMQDIYARTPQKDLDTFFIESEQDRKLVICSVNNCMAFDEVERLLKVLVHHKLIDMLQKEESRLTDEWIILERAKVALEESKKPVYKKLKAQREESKYFQERKNHFRTLYRQEAAKYQQAQNDARKYNTIKSLLA